MRRRLSRARPLLAGDVLSSAELVLRGDVRCVGMLVAGLRGFNPDIELFVGRLDEGV